MRQEDDQPLSEMDADMFSKVSQNSKKGDEKKKDHGIHAKEKDFNKPHEDKKKEEEPPKKSKFPKKQNSPTKTKTIKKQVSPEKSDNTSGVKPPTKKLSLLSSADKSG